MSTRRRLICRLALVSALFAGRADASSFTVNPTQIYFSGRTVSALLTLRNESTEPLRFQLSAFSWDQNEHGEMQLQPTEDVIFFPTLLTLGPKEERKVRVGTTTAFGPVERTYRIFVEELPSAEPSTQAGVRVLTKMGIPVFLRPAKMVAEGGLQDLRVTDGTFSFKLRNSGNVHFVPQRVRVRALGPTNNLLFERELAGWYVLAGGTRIFDLELPKSDCSGISSLAVDVQIGGTALTDQIVAPPSACSG
jgi:fimbrial chaperone protein